MNSAAFDVALLARPLAPFPKVTLWLLRDGRSVDAFLEHLVAWATELERLAPQGADSEDYITVLRYIWSVVGPSAAQEVRHRLIEVAPAFGGAMSSYYDEQLIEKGRKEGRDAAIRDVLIAQLRARFGSVDARAEGRISGATAEELGRWIQRVVLVDRIDDLFVE